jgi:hypothetical protein
MTQRAAVLNALWQRIEVRADEQAANGVVIVKLTPRADRAANAHALIMAARQYANSGDPGPDGGYDPNDGGPGATLNTGEIGFRAHPSPPVFAVLTDMTAKMTAKIADGFLERLRLIGYARVF